MCHGLGEHIAVETTEDSPSEQVIHDKGGKAVEKWREGIGFFPFQKENLRPSRTVVPLRISKMLVIILVPIVDQVCLQFASVGFRHKGMLLQLGKTQLVLSE